MSELLPEEKPEGLQMWPLGHGIVASTVAVSGSKGMFILAGVPDRLQGEPGKEMEGNPLELIRALIDLPENQSCVMVYPSVDAIEATIGSLRDLQRMLAAALGLPSPATPPTPNKDEAR